MNPGPRTGDQVERASDPFTDPVQLTRPPVLVVACVSVVLLLAGIVAVARASVTQTVAGPGMLLPGGTLIPAVTTTSGQVTSVEVRADEHVVEGQSLVRLVDRSGSTRVVTAPVSGTVVQATVTRGEVVSPGRPVAQIAESGLPLQVTAFVPASQARTIRSGFSVQVYPVAADENSSAYVPGQVTLVEPLIATQQTIESTFGGSASATNGQSEPLQAVVISFAGNPTEVAALPVVGATSVAQSLQTDPRVTVKIIVGEGTVLSVLGTDR